jgi:hypothetical protein
MKKIVQVKAKNLDIKVRNSKTLEEGWINVVDIVDRIVEAFLETLNSDKKSNKQKFK